MRAPWPLCLGGTSPRRRTEAGPTEATQPLTGVEAGTAAIAELDPAIAGRERPLRGLRRAHVTLPSAAEEGRICNPAATDLDVFMRLPLLSDTCGL
jgi:hypothetical protein